jgi:hypothetical protein
MADSDAIVQSTSSVVDVIEELRKSPIFQLSLASKELFHSNFLAWFCEQYPEHAATLLANLLQRSPETCYPIEVYRESKNTDLLIKCRGGSELVVENKVKSLPSRQQLMDYYSKPKNPERTAFLLLSLTPPSFDLTLENGAVWRHAHYGKLADELGKAISDIAGYQGDLIQDYVAFIRRLDELKSHFIVDWKNRDADFFGAREQLRRLEKIRMHDVFAKLLYAQLVDRTAKILVRDGIEVVHQPLPDGKPGEIALSAGMTRGRGLFDLKYLLTKVGGKDVLLGIQLQGRQFRLCVETKSRRARKIAIGLLQPKLGKRTWFDFQPVPGDSDEYPTKGEFNRYGSVFYYRSKKLGRTAPADLVNLIVGYVHLIESRKRRLRNQVEAAVAG